MQRLYWNKGLGDLAELIDTVDKFQSEQLQEMGEKAQKELKRSIAGRIYAKNMNGFLLM